MTLNIAMATPPVENQQQNDPKRPPLLTIIKQKFTVERKNTLEILMLLPVFDPDNEGAAVADTTGMFNYENAERNLLSPDWDDLRIRNRIRAEGYQSEFVAPRLPTLRLPFEVETVNIIKHLMRTNQSDIVAKHLMKADVDFLMGESHSIFMLRGMASMLELCYMPQGQMVRRNIIERAETMNVVVVLTILISTDQIEMAKTLKDWIDLAYETIHLKNLYGFTSLMCGLLTPAVKLEITAWKSLRRYYPASWSAFKRYLKPCFKNMMKGIYPAEDGTTTPNFLPSVLLFNKYDIKVNENADEITKTPHSTLPPSIEIMNIDEVAASYHLDVSVHYPYHCAQFKQNASAKINRMIAHDNVEVNPVLMELFKTEFLMNFVWGDKWICNDHHFTDTPWERFYQMRLATGAIVQMDYDEGNHDDVSENSTSDGDD